MENLKTPHRKDPAGVQTRNLLAGRWPYPRSALEDLTLMWTTPTVHLLILSSLMCVCMHAHTHPIRLLLGVGQHLLQGSYRQRLLQHKSADWQIWRYILKQQENSYKFTSKLKSPVHCCVGHQKSHGLSCVAQETLLNLWWVQLWLCAHTILSKHVNPIKYSMNGAMKAMRYRVVFKL